MLPNACLSGAKRPFYALLGSIFTMISHLLPFNSRKCIVGYPYKTP